LPRAIATPVLRSKLISSANRVVSFCQASTWPEAATMLFVRS
jgi:hypothetical protein